MNSLLSATARAMRVASTPVTIRSTPVDYIPLEERRRIIEKSLIHVWRLAHSLGVNLGGVPTVIINSDKPFVESEVLENISHLHLDALCMYHILGTADVARDAVEGILDQHTTKTVPNFQALIDDAKNPNLPDIVD